MDHKILIAVAIFLLSACAGSGKYSFVDNPEINFDNYRHFSWIAGDPQMSERPDYSARNDDRIENAIVSALETKGYVFVADRNEADFVVGYSVGIRKNVKLEAAPDYYGGNWVHASKYATPAGSRNTTLEIWGPEAFWEGINVDYGATIEKGRPEGTLTIDIFDVRSKTPAWQGIVEKEITQQDRKNATDAFNAAITKVFAPFPINRTIQGD